METTRRRLLPAGALSLLGWATKPRTALAALAVRPGRRPPEAGVLVSLFLRGGADGLNVVVPHGDEDYYRNRPTLAVGRPGGRRAAAGSALDLDGFFGLHPALAPLLPLYHCGQLAIVHACGSGDQTRSHFEAMATVERGLFREAGPASGWLARHLESAPWENDSPLRAVAIGAIVPAALGGARTATALSDVADLRLQARPGREAAMRSTLAELYGARSERDLLDRSGRQALSVLRTLSEMRPSQARPANGAVYPKDDLGDGLRQVALLMKAEIGLEAACLDHGGYDTHVAQGVSGGLLAGRLTSLGTALHAFASDLGPARWAQTTVVVMTEFGRRVQENSGAGTDHGRGTVMMVLGGRGIAGGRVHGVWPGLAPEKLEGPGDLHVTTDYRNVLAEVLSQRLGNPHVDAVFPDLARRPVGILA